MKEATAVKGARQFIQLLDGGRARGWRGVLRGGFFLEIKIISFLSFERGGWQSGGGKYRRREKVWEGPAGWRRRHRLMKSEHVAINSGRFSPYHLLF